MRTHNNVGGQKYFICAVFYLSKDVKTEYEPLDAGVRAIKYLQYTSRICIPFRSMMFVSDRPLNHRIRNRLNENYDLFYVE